MIEYSLTVIMKGENNVEEKKCLDCGNYMQHYAFSKGKLFRVYCGHCKLPGVRRKRPDTDACENFIPGTADTDGFVTKEYLSKELLKYVLSLELLPKITDSQT